MPNPPVPHYLKPQNSKLEAGPDESLEPDSEPVDPASRSVPPLAWPAVDSSDGPSGPPDRPAGRPATDPARRSVAPFSWPTGPPGAIPNRPLRELAIPVPDIDPDIAMWPATIVSRWPFTGPPDVGVWPTGWLGVDNTGTLYVCTQGGQPGTWTALGGGGVLTQWGTAGTSHFAGSGSPVGVFTPSAIGDLYVDNTTPALWQANGLTNTSWQLAAAGTGILASVQYSPPTQVQHTLGGAMTVFDAHLVTPSFLAPASGQVIVGLEIFASPLTNAYFQVGVGEGGSLTGPAAYMYQVGGGGFGQRFVASILISGLTPGSAHVFQFMGGSFNGVATQVFIGGPNTAGAGVPPALGSAGPALMTVTAA